jgi:hypothetical protein
VLIRIVKLEGYEIVKLELVLIRTVPAWWRQQWHQAAASPAAPMSFLLPFSGALGPKDATHTQQTGR